MDEFEDLNEGAGIGPEQAGVGPGQMGPEQVGPEQAGPEQAGPEQMGRAQMGRAQMGPWPAESGQRDEGEGNAADAPHAGVSGGASPEGVGGWGPPPAGAEAQGIGYVPRPPGLPRYGGDAPHIEQELAHARSRLRRLRIISSVASATLIAGVIGGVVGHEFFRPSSTNTSAQGQSPSGGSVSPGSSSSGSGSGGSGLSPSEGNPFPSGGGSTSPSSGGSGTGSIGSGPAESASIAAHVDAGLVDVNTSIDGGQAQGAGTGMVLTSNGEVLTNNHVVEGATSISVTDVGNGKTYSAKVVGYDMSKDVAVLQLEGASGLRTVKIGNSSSVAVGEQVVAIGNANGAGGTPSYAGGTVTATNQSITAYDQLTYSSEQLAGMIETNADVIPGDSGGPLVNSSGQVLGMDTAGSGTFSLGAQSSGNQGFAIPINEATSVAHQIENGTTTGTVHVGPTAFLGIEVGSSTSRGGFGSGYFNGGSSSSQSQGGVLIDGVLQGEPAAASGLAQGDVITSIDGHTVTSNSSLSTVMAQDVKPGQKVSVVYTNQAGQSVTTTVTLASGPAQ